MLLGLAKKGGARGGEARESQQTVNRTLIAIFAFFFLVLAAMAVLGGLGVV